MSSLKEIQDLKDRYALLGDNEISVEKDTEAEKQIFKQIEDCFKAERELESTLKNARFSFYILAASLRKKYLNKDSNSYHPEFHEWYSKRRNLERQLGSLSNFTRYALAGELISFIVSTQEDPTTYLAKLPSGMTALYEIHRVKTELYKRPKDESIFFKLFFRRALRASVTSEVRFEDKPLIYPEVTTHELKEWLDGWMPEEKGLSKKAQRKTFSVPVATIYAHKSLFDFDKKSGDHVGKIGIKELGAFIKELKSTLAKKAPAKLAIESGFETIEKKFQKRAARFDPARKIVEAKSARPKKK